MSKNDLSKLADEVFADAFNLSEQDEKRKRKRGDREGTRRYANARIIDLDRIKPDPVQVRKVDQNSESIAELSRSIQRHGVLQPITVRYDNQEDLFVIVMGERRYWASLKAGNKNIPCIVKDLIRRDEISFQQMVENLQRENLNPVEEAEGIKRLCDEFKISHKEVSEQLGKSESYISRTTRLNNLPKEIKKEIATSQFLQKNLSKEHLIQIARQNDPEKQFRLWEIIKDGQINIRQARELAKKQKGKKEKPEKPKQVKAPLSLDEEIQILDKKVKDIDFNEISAAGTLQLAESINKLTRTLITAANKLIMLK